MTSLKLSPLTHLASFVLAVLIALTAFSGTTATAAGPAFYRAELSAPPAKARFVASDLAWNCNGSTCTAIKGTKRPAKVCAAVAKEAGAVVAFHVDGAELDAATLAKCNGKKAG